MARERNDAWMRIPPLDGLAAVPADPSQSESQNEPGRVGFSMFLKGTEAIFVVEGSKDTIEVLFRYRRRAGTWQMFRREGAGWVADGPPSERAGKLLGQCVLVMQGVDPRSVFS